MLGIDSLKNKIGDLATLQSCKPSTHLVIKSQLKAKNQFKVGFGMCDLSVMQSTLSQINFIFKCPHFKVIYCNLGTQLHIVYEFEGNKVNL